MTETTFDEEIRTMAESFNALKHGAAILFNTLNSVYALHEVAMLTSEDGAEQEICSHCSEIAGEDRGIVYPCPTVAILTEYLVEAEAPKETPEEETPAE
ncbi:MAG: hypothetical protein ACKOQ8_02245 [Micrococcales bacterium]